MDASDNERKWILGILPSGKMVGREEAAKIFWAWRCLYAEVVAARVDNRELKPGNGTRETVPGKGRHLQNLNIYIKHR